MNNFKFIVPAYVHCMQMRCSSLLVISTACIFCIETISVDQTVAQAFKLRAYQDVIVNIINPKVRSL